ncbi:HCLS1-binding protein 3, partial [Stegodyphus mimosarum]
MSTPSVTLRSLKNEETGIDISVPRFQEEEAPLGGISILYEISVLTRLDLFKTRLHKYGDVVHFSIFKAYREIEDLYNKLNKKYPKAGLPPVPKSSTADKYTSDERVQALDNFFNAVSKNIEIIHSSVFTQFIGINSQRLPSFSMPKTDSSNESDKTNSEEVKSKGNSGENISNSCVSEVFPKMKVLAAEKTVDKPSVLPSDSAKNLDLFEEVKSGKEATSTDISTKTVSTSLFGDFEEDALFTSKPVKPAPQPKKVENVSSTTRSPTEKIPSPKKPAVVMSDKNVDDSQIIIKDRKVGDVSLFEEQDLGDYITKDEESLFFVTPSSEESKKNILLFLDDGISSTENDLSVNENLDDLLNLELLPSSSILTKKLETEELMESQPVPKPEEIAKPVPLPRKKSLGKLDVEGIPKKPEVLPRNVFMNKPQVPSKPSVATAGAAKPAPPPKPKPPPPTKPKPAILKNHTDVQGLDAANANEPEKMENLNTVSDLANDLNKLDILKYIEQESKTLEAKPSLFD